MALLNPEQIKAVEHVNGPLLILAGAGSGKTRVLTERIVRLIEHSNVPPPAIFAVTFTNKAAYEMKARVEKRIGFLANQITIGTFHSICARLLRHYATAGELTANFVIYDESDQHSLLKEVYQLLNIDEKQISIKGVLERISRAKDGCITPDMMAQNSGNWFDQKVAEIYREYQRMLRENDAADFGDLIMQTVQMLRANAEICADLQKRYQFLLVDEYQDTNRAQYDLIRLMGASHHNVCVVGDDDQSIYSWRGADISNILNFERDFPNAHVIRLEQNYRSSGNILTAANHVVKNNACRKGKALWTENPTGEPLTVYQSGNEHEEARFVIGEIRKHAREGLAYCNMAIFYRTNAQSRVLEDELRRSQIPYKIFGGLRFYDRKEIKDILSYLKLISNPADMISLRRVINSPPRGIGKTTIDKILEYAVKTGSGAMPAIQDLLASQAFSGGIHKRLDAFVVLINSFQQEVSTLSLPRLVKKVIEGSGYISALNEKKTLESESRIENLQELVTAVEDFCRQTEGLTLTQFIDQVSLVNEIDRLDENVPSIPMMTMHLAKGLEFPVVFITGLEEGLFPHSRSIESESMLEEERRLCYVGITRGEKKVYLTHTQKRRVYGVDRYNSRSRFLDELPVDIVEWKRSSFHEGWGSGFQESFSGHLSLPTPFKTHGDDDFDQRPPEERVGGDIRIGAKVAHSQFGRGIVRRIEGESDSSKVTVYFENGLVKKLMVKYANLQIL